MGRESRKPERSIAGQTLVEFAFILPVLLMLTAGVIDLARGALFYNTVSTAARDGARFGIVLTDAAWGYVDEDNNPFLSDGNVEGTYSPTTAYLASAYENTIVGQIARRDTALDPAQTTVQIDIMTGDNKVRKHHLDPLEVTVSHPFTPLVSYILGTGSITVTASSVMIIE